MRSQRLQDADLYVITIIKKPLVAIRYRLPDGQVRILNLSNICRLLNLPSQIRRIQLNFRPEPGYDIAVKMLKALGLPIRDKNSPAEPHISQSIASGHFLPSSMHPSPINTPLESEAHIPTTELHNYRPQ